MEKPLPILELIICVNVYVMQQKNSIIAGQIKQILIIFPFSLLKKDGDQVRFPSFSYQIRMVLYRLFDLLRLNADVPLRCTCAAMLEEPLHQ